MGAAYTRAVISLTELAGLYAEHAAALDHAVTPVRLAGREGAGEVVIGDDAPVLMGTVNLSRDSTYRESIAVSTDAAIRMGRVQAAQGAALVDVGAESSTARATRVSPADQIAALVPVVAGLRECAVVSVETYEPAVVRACLDAGAGVLNMTGRQHEDAMLALAAEHDAGVILCFSAPGNVRDNIDLPLEADPAPYLLDHFGPRLERARSLGVTRVVVDPGMGFYYGNLTDPLTRARHQARVLLAGFRLRELGVPVGNALPHAFDLFGDEFRTAEGFFAVLASLGGTHLFRTHEVARVRPVLDALRLLPAR